MKKENRTDKRLFELLSLICELGDMRKIPQFFYRESINRQQMINLRRKLLDYKRKNPKVKEIDFILQSSGGSADEAYKIIRTLRNNFATVNIIVPYRAKSAATLLALGGNNIIMDEFGEFGPIDAQILKQLRDGPPDPRIWESALIDETALNRIQKIAGDYYSFLFEKLFNNRGIPIDKNILNQNLADHVSKFFEPIVKQIDPYRIGEKRRVLDIARYYAIKLLNMYHKELEKYKKFSLVDYLTHEFPAHGVVIDFSTISQYLDFIIPSKCIEPSPDYEYRLSEISGHLISQYYDYILDKYKEDYFFIGFVDKSMLHSRTTDKGNEKLTSEKRVQSLKKQKKKQSS